MTSRRRGGAFAAVLTLAALAATACTGANAVSQSVSGSNGWQTGDSSLRWVPPGDRHAVTGVRGNLLDGTSFDLAQLRGDVVVVNFWASDCAPCRSEAQALEAVYRQNRDKGVAFLGVDIRDNRASAAAFVRAHHVTYPSLDDESDLLALRFPGLPPNATPSTVVLDRVGRIAARHSGEILYTDLGAVVARVLAEPSR